MEYEITLRNHKDTPITVEVNEPIGGDWEMLSSTYKSDEDGGVRRAISSARREGRHFGAALSRARALVGRDLGAALAAPRRGERRITNEMTTGPLRCRERIASPG